MLSDRQRCVCSCACQVFVLLFLGCLSVSFNGHTCFADTTKSIVAEEADSSRPLSPGQNPGVFKQKPEPQRLVDVKDDVPDKQKQTEAHKNGIVPTEVPVTSEDFTAAKEKLCDTDPRSAEGHEGPVVWEPGNEVETVAVYKTPANVSSPQRLANRQLVVTFNYMSSLINQGQFDQFQTLSRKLGQKFATDADMQCLLCYLQTSRDLYGNNYDAAKKSINNAMEIVPATSNPKYFTVEIFTAKTRMYVSQKKLSKLEDTLTDVKQVRISRVSKFRAVFYPNGIPNALTNRRERKESYEVPVHCDVCCR